MSDEPPPAEATAPVTDDASTKTTPDGPSATQTLTDGAATTTGPGDATTKVTDEPQAAMETPKEPMTQVPDEPPSAAALETPKEQQPQMPDEPPSAASPETLNESPTQVPDEPTETPKHQSEGTQSPQEIPKEPRVSEEAPTPEPPTHDEPLEEAPAPETTEEPPSSPVRGAPLQLRKVAVNSFKDVRPVLVKTLAQLKDPFVKKLEKQTGMDREKLFYSAVGFVVFYLLFCPGNALASDLIANVYPLCRSILAVRKQTKDENTQWLAYWCAFAAFTLVDHLVAPFELLFALYLVAKTAALLYLSLPQTFGAHNVYVKYVHPLAKNHLGKRKTR